METLFFILWNLHIILESLPISSSSHLHLLNSHLARIGRTTPLKISSTTDFLMHIPTALILTATLIRHRSLLMYQPFFDWIAAVCIADLITGCAYLIMKKKGNPRLPLSLGFLISACPLLSLYFLHSCTTQHV